MDQNPKDLDALVNEVDQKAREFLSFDDYLASRDVPIPNPDNIPGLESADQEKDPEWQKPAPDVEGNSSSSSNEKADGKDESKPPTNAGLASPEKPRREETWSKERPSPIGPEPPEPRSPAQTDPNVVWPEAPYKPVETIPLTEKILKIEEVEWNGQLSQFLYEVEEVVKVDSEILSIYSDGQKVCAATADINELIEHFHSTQVKFKKLGVYLESVHNGIRAKLATESAETRKKAYEKLNRTNRSVAKNKQQAERMKQERASAGNGEIEKVAAPKKVKPGIGIKDATLYHASGFAKELVIQNLRAAGKLDDATIAHITQLYTKGGTK